MRRELPPQLSTSHRSRAGDMTLPDVVKLYNLSLNVPVDRFVAGIGTTRFYELVKDGVIRVRKNGLHTTAPVEDLFQLLARRSSRRLTFHFGARGSVPRQRRPGGRTRAALAAARCGL